MSESRGPLVLYVDDDPDYREAVGAMLASGGFRVAEASTAEEGLALLRRMDVDAVLLDLMMEEVDAGVNFTREVRASGSDVPIFLLSSVGDALAAERATEELGVAAVLQKPVRRETLLGLLRARIL